MRIFYCLIGLLLVILLTTCSTHKENEGMDNRRIIMENDIDSYSLESLQRSNMQLTVNLNNNTYEISLTRTPNELLPLVETESGTFFIDNDIILNINMGGKRIFKQTFTKEDFSRYLSNTFIEKSILEGMVFDKTTQAGMTFAASVCYPQTDLYIPFSITITDDGKMFMEKNERLEEVYYSE